MSQIFVVNPQYTAYATGQQNKMPANQPFFTLFLGTIGLFGLFMTLLLSAAMVSDWVSWVQAVQTRVGTVGIITGRAEIEGEDDDETTYYLQYEYTTIEGETFEDEHVVDIDFFNLIPVGYEMPIRYDIDDPARSEFASDNEIPLALTLLTLIIGGVVLSLTGAGWRAARDDARIRNGQRVEAEIVEAHGTYDSDGDFLLKLQVAFTSPTTNERITFEHTAQGYNIKPDTMPDDGTAAAVQYIDEKHYQLL